MGTFPEPPAPRWLSGPRPRTLLLATIAALSVAAITLGASSGAQPTTRRAAVPRAAAPAELRTAIKVADITAATSAKKGVGAWYFNGASQALADSGASWYYTWSYNHSGISTPAGAQFVPMIWGAADVTSADLSQAEQYGNVLLGFNEPDNSSQSNMTVAQALNLWPRLMATGMTLGSPAVALNAATPGSWLDQFMSGVKARGYRVNFIAVHWYGSSFATATAVAQLKSYLQAIHNRYQLPIWLTEFALANWDSGTFPTNTQQAAFLSAALPMLEGLSFVQEYAWFALPTYSAYGNTGLFNPGPVVTTVGKAYESTP